MSDQPVRTIVDTDEGELAFQRYFVHRRCEPRVKGFRFDGVEKAEPASGVCEALQSADSIVICPSNPWVSVDPILRVISHWNRGKPVIAVSPIIGGQAVKGPAAKMYREMGIEPSAPAVAKHYHGLATGFVLDEIDKQLKGDIMGLNMRTLVTNTLMDSLDSRERLAKDLLDFIGTDL